MDATQEPNSTVVYQLRNIANREIDPLAGEVISTHTTAKEAWAAFDWDSQDSRGESTGDHAMKAVVRVDPEGRESMILPQPAAPYTMGDHS